MTSEPTQLMPQHEAR